MNQKKLVKKILEFRKKRRWKVHHTPKSMAISLVLEATEVLEIFQWTKGNQIPKKERQHFKDELADVLWWLLIIAHDCNIDLEKAFLKKLEKNKKKYPVKTNK